ncbi:uncharacterized protein ISCGN_016965 [Ixodes scapularis]
MKDLSKLQDKLADCFRAYTLFVAVAQPAPTGPDGRTTVLSAKGGNESAPVITVPDGAQPSRAVVTPESFKAPTVVHSPPSEDASSKDPTDMDETGESIKRGLDDPEPSLGGAVPKPIQGKERNKKGRFLPLHPTPSDVRTRHDSKTTVLSAKGGNESAPVITVPDGAQPSRAVVTPESFKAPTVVHSPPSEDASSKDPTDMDETGESIKRGLDDPEPSLGGAVPKPIQGKERNKKGRFLPLHPTPSDVRTRHDSK